MLYSTIKTAALLAGLVSVQAIPQALQPAEGLGASWDDATKEVNDVLKRHGLSPVVGEDLMLIGEMAAMEEPMDGSVVDLQRSESCKGARMTFSSLKNQFSSLKGDFKSAKATKALECTTYQHFEKGCVNGYNIKKYPGSTVKQCEKLCTEYGAGCKGFEFGVPYGGGGVYKAGDCQLQSSANMQGCNGAYHNLDMYVKQK